MTGFEVLSEISKHRAAQAAKIKSAPGLFKVCECCSSLSWRTKNVCPVCRAYRWDEDQARVVAIAEEAGARPIGLTLAVLPRTVAEFKAS